jgi:hypothetical protein
MDSGFRTTPEARTPSPEVRTPAEPVFEPVLEPATKRRRVDPSRLPKPEPAKPRPKPKPKLQPVITGSKRRNLAVRRSSNKRVRIYVAPHLMKTQARTASAVQNTLADHAGVPAPSPIVEVAREPPPLEEYEREPTPLEEYERERSQSHQEKSGREISASKLAAKVERSADMPDTPEKRGYRFEQEEARQPGFIPIPSHYKMKLKHSDSRDTKTFKYQDLLF